MQQMVARQKRRRQYSQTKTAPVLTGALARLSDVARSLDGHVLQLGFAHAALLDTAFNHQVRICVADYVEEPFASWNRASARWITNGSPDMTQCLPTSSQRVVRPIGTNDLSLDFDTGQIPVRRPGGN